MALLRGARRLHLKPLLALGLIVLVYLKFGLLDQLPSSGEPLEPHHRGGGAEKRAREPWEAGAVNVHVPGERGRGVEDVPAARDVVIEEPHPEEERGAEGQQHVNEPQRDKNPPEHEAWRKPGDDEKPGVREVPAAAAGMPEDEKLEKTTPEKEDDEPDVENHEQREMQQAGKQMQLAVQPAHQEPSPGENGKGVHIDKNKLTPEERKKYEDGFKAHSFNLYASDMISVRRTLLDVRDARCKEVTYRPPSQLPSASVIIIFHKEAWSALLRTVHSVIDRSPPELLKEVILVDDASNLEHLGAPLEAYIKGLPATVKLVRAREREGLIRARLMGAEAATGEVLIFLDSHCECTEGWLEPLLDRIADNHTNVLVPVIDIISDESLSYGAHGAKGLAVGGFNWGLIFNWHSPPERDRNRPGAPISPLRSPTMAGGLFAISAKYFDHLGRYDPGFDIWGGENLELSFKTWMCGGTLETIPCSHVGHIFRKKSPYSWDSKNPNPLKRNLVRLALVWLDEYKDYYLQRINHDLGNYGDISERVALRERLGCKSFNWYMRNIYPELFVPGDSIAMGEIRNKARPTCVDALMDSKELNKPVKTWPCHNQGGNQYFMLSPAGEIRRDEICLDYNHQNDRSQVIQYSCHGGKGNQHWEYRQDDHLYHVKSARCLELSADSKVLLMRPCDPNKPEQVWFMKRKTPSAHTPPPAV